MTRPAGALLAVDVGNTNTVLGLFEDGQLLRHWRLTTRRDETADEIVLSVRGLLQASGRAEAPQEVIVASVVPSLRFPRDAKFIYKSLMLSHSYLQITRFNLFAPSSRVRQ